LLSDPVTGDWRFVFMNITEEDGLVILKPVGRIDHGNAGLFQSQLSPHLDNCSSDGTRILLDFSDVEYISSVGLRVLMMAAKKLKPITAGISMTCLQPVVGEIFRISRFDYVLPVYDDRETARIRIEAARKTEPA
jgi:anti-anti-sigma factor